MKLKIVIPAIVAGGCLAACGGGLTGSSPSATSSPSSAASPSVNSSPSAAALELIAVAQVTFPYVAQYNYFSVCSDNGGTSRCPYTDRLKARLVAARITLCRCQNPAPSLEVTATPTQTGGVAHVVLGYVGHPVKFDLVIVRVGGKLLVDDELCTGGDASTSIYVGESRC